MSLSKVCTSFTSIIPAGNVLDFIICTFFLFLIYVGHAPLFINSIVPLYKSIIAISNVENTSLFWLINDVFILQQEQSQH